MSGDESMLTDLRIIPDNSWPVNGIGGTVLYAREIGIMRLVRHVGDSSTYGEVKNVLFCSWTGRESHLYCLLNQEWIQIFFLWITSYHKKKTRRSF